VQQRSQRARSAWTLALQQVQNAGGWSKMLAMTTLQQP
jgi:hypothetical protein